MTQVAKEIQSKRWHCYLRPKLNFNENIFLSCLMYRLSPLNYTNLQVLSICQCRTVRRLRFNPWVRKIPLERGTATHSSIFARKIQRTEESGRIQSRESQRVRYDLGTEHALTSTQTGIMSFFTVYLLDVNYIPLHEITKSRGNLFCCCWFQIYG